jgi:dienelactone hydrolase
MAFGRFILAALVFIPIQIWGQQTITFSAEDGVTVTADHYVVSTQKPYLILLHQAGFSRGEYRETAPKLANLGFNCLAVDLRSGSEVNFIKNQTALDAKAKGLPTEYIDASADIVAALEFVASRSSKPIILVGSSYSASLALVEATENFKIKAVVAFSPGEYFGEQLNVKQSTQNLYIPVLALSTRLEYDDMKKMLDHLNAKHLQLFRPSQGEGVHGSRALWERNQTSEEYWLALTQFFSQINLQ